MKRATTIVALLLIVFISVCSCNNRLGGKAQNLLNQIRNIISGGTETMELASYNTGLLPDADKTVMNNLPRDKDVLVLQEVWLKSDALAIKALYNTSYPYFQYVEPVLARGATCTDPSYIYAFGQCLSDNSIATIDWDSITPCLSVLNQWLQNDKECALCVLTGNVNGDADTLTNCFTGNGYTEAYNGSVGLVVLSKKPIKKPTFTEVPHFLLRRGIQTFCIDGIYFGHSHFSFNYTIPLPDQWDQVQMADAVIAKRPQIFMGDLNTGLNYQPAGYQELVGAGYQSINPRLATYCPNTSYPTCTTTTEPAQKIDHIMLDKAARGIMWNGIQSFNVQVFNQGNKQYSDHVGISSTIRYRKFAAHPACRD